MPCKYLRERYYTWKEECHKMVPLVGSGKFVAMAIVAEDSQPLEESSAENQESLVKTAVTDKRVLQWMLVLSQIGLVGCLLILLCSSSICL